MESILDEAMPVRRRPLIPPFPVQLKVGALALLIIGSAYFGFHLLNSNQTLIVLDTFDFQQHEDGNFIIPEAQQLKTPTQSAAGSKVAAVTLLQPKKDLSKAQNTTASSNSQRNISQPLFPVVAIVETSNDNLQTSNESVNFQAQTHAPAIPESEIPVSDEIIVADQMNTSNEIPSSEIISNSEEIALAQDQLENSESLPIVHPKLNSYFSLGASAGNYTFSGATLYGQLQFNWHVPISNSFNLTVLTAAGKGLLYQNTEVLLSEYSNNATDGTILGSEAPSDDLSAFVDVKSVSNVLLGTQVQWNISNNWTLGMGVNAAYLLNIQHQAIQSTSLLPEGQEPQQIFTPSEISEKFAHWNNLDFRLNASLQYHMTGKWSMVLAYNRGFTNLLKHPFSAEHIIQMNSLSLGLNYRF